MKRWMMHLLIPGLLLSTGALAQNPGPEQYPRSDQSDEQEGPGRGVARLSLMNGDVSVRRGDSGDWVAGAINAPLLVEDRILTGPGARAEVQFDFYNRIRLASDTEIRFSQLDNGQYQIQVAKGMVTFSALKGSAAQVEISTPGASLRPVAAGSYRLTVQPDGAAEITVRSGEAEIFSPRGSQTLRPGRTMLVRLGPAGESEFQLTSAAPRDGWDDFNQQRDRELQRTASYKYMSRDIYGAEDLDGNGDWTYVAPYGWCWSPYAASGWAPYRYGRWTWADWYGWTWVSYDPWGWAPYHYGRWFNHGNRWCWYPGAIVGVHHYWSPALVGWVGWNSWGGFSAGIGVGWGAVGWIPLAPFEPCHRWWGPGFYGGYRGGYVNNRTTIVNNVNVTNIYRNARVNNGVTVVNGNDFSRGAVGRPLRLGGEELARANVAHGMLPVTPAHESLRMSDRAVRSDLASATRQGTANERFFTRTQAARVDRVPFDQQRNAVEQTIQRNSSTGRGVSVIGDTNRSITPSNGNGGGNNGGTNGWRRVGDNGVVIHGAESNRSNDTNWGRFGDPSVGSSRTTTAPERTVERQSVQPSGQSNASGQSNSGWRTFGDPGRGNTGEANRMERGGASSPSVAPRNEAPRMEAPRNEAPRNEAPRMDRGAWSTGGSSPRNDSPKMEAPRSESPRMQTPRSESPRMEAPRNETPRSSPAPSGGRSSDNPGRSRNNFTSSESPRSSAPSFGGGSSSGMRSSPSFSAPSSMGGSTRSSGGGGGSRTSGGGGGGGRSGGGGGGGRSGGGRGR